MKYVIITLFGIFLSTGQKQYARPQEENLELNKATLVKTLKDMGVQHIDVVLAQAILESGTFTSNIFKTKNNMFGMKVPGRRQTTALNKRGYATYSSWIDSVRDYKLYQDFITKNKNVSRSKYLSILAKGYCSNPNYVSMLNKIIKQNKQYTI